MSKTGILKPAVEGKASNAQKEDLLELYTALSKATPPKGDEQSWKEKTTALVDASQALVDGKAGATASLKKAANCKACHDTHKGK